MAIYRFKISFEDYDDVSLLRILRNMCKKKGLNIYIETANYAISQLGRAKSQQNFGNAGSVSNLLSAAQLCMQKRVKSPSSKNKEELIIPEEFSRSLWQRKLLIHQQNYKGKAVFTHFIYTCVELKQFEGQKYLI
jgi:hypothetical protein